MDYNFVLFSTDRKSRTKINDVAENVRAAFREINYAALFASFLETSLDSPITEIANPSSLTVRWAVSDPSHPLLASSLVRASDNSRIEVKGLWSNFKRMIKSEADLFDKLKAYPMQQSALAFALDIETQLRVCSDAEPIVQYGNFVPSLVAYACATADQTVRISTRGSEWASCALRTFMIFVSDDLVARWADCFTRPVIRPDLAIPAARFEHKRLLTDKKATNVQMVCYTCGMYRDKLAGNTCSFCNDGDYTLFAKCEHCNCNASCVKLKCRYLSSVGSSIKLSDTKKLTDISAYITKTILKNGTPLQWYGETIWYPLIQASLGKPVILLQDINERQYMEALIAHWFTNTAKPEFESLNKFPEKTVTKFKNEMLKLYFEKHVLDILSMILDLLQNPNNEQAKQQFVLRNIITTYREAYLHTLENERMFDIIESQNSFHGQLKVQPSFEDLKYAKDTIVASDGSYLRFSPQQCNYSVESNDIKYGDLTLFSNTSDELTTVFVTDDIRLDSGFGKVKNIFPNDKSPAKALFDLTFQFSPNLIMTSTAYTKINQKMVIIVSGGIDADGNITDKIHATMIKTPFEAQESSVLSLNSAKLKYPTYCHSTKLYASPEGQLYFVCSGGTMTLDYKPTTFCYRYSVTFSSSSIDSKASIPILGRCENLPSLPFPCMNHKMEYHPAYGLVIFSGRGKPVIHLKRDEWQELRVPYISFNSMIDGTNATAPLARADRPFTDKNLKVTQSSFTVALAKMTRSRYFQTSSSDSKKQEWTQLKATAKDALDSFFETSGASSAQNNQSSDSNTGILSAILGSTTNSDNSGQPETFSNQDRAAILRTHLNTILFDA